MQIDRWGKLTLPGQRNLKEPIMKFQLKSICLLTLLGLLLLAGCGGENNDTNTLGTDPRVTSGGTETVFAKFDATSLPLPNDVAWATTDPNPADGVTQVYLTSSEGDSPEMAGLKQLVNAQALPGLSPNMFLTLPLSGAVDSSTLELLIFRTDDPQLPALLGALAQGDNAAAGAAAASMEFRSQSDFEIVDDFAHGVVKLLPKTPFTPGAAYAVVVKTGLLDSNGFAASSSFTMRALKSTTPFSADSPYAKFENLRAAFNDGQTALFSVVAGVSAVAKGSSWSKDKVLVMWTFHTSDRTLSLTPTDPEKATVAYPTVDGDAFAVETATFKGLSSMITANSLTWTNLQTGADSSTPAGLPASAVLGSVLPDTSAMGMVYAGHFSSPKLATGGQTMDDVTFRLTTPATAGPWPVVLFQHGITSSKDAALPLANTLASVGYATLAIDAIYHGDRTTEGAASGDGFFTTNLVQDRANIYQAALDLWEAVDVIEAGIDLDGDDLNDIDSSKIEFVAHSLGSIIGSAFLSQETRVNKMILSSPSAMLVNVLDETSLPSMQALVAALGYTPGTTSYYVFLNLAQWLLDPADASYNGIGSNSTDKLMSLYAYADPIVSPASSKVFLSNVGIDPATKIVVDPDAVNVSFPNPATDLAAGTYQYGLQDKPVVHSFLLSPLFSAEETWYAGYSPDLQVKATTGAQMQVGGYLAAP